MALRVLTAVLFYPRGGSAHATRALVRGLRQHGCEVTLVSGSRSGVGGHGDARRFYGEVEAVDYDPALASPAPLRYEGPPGTAPIHPSYEDRPGAPDAVFAALDDLDYERQVRAWARELERVGAATADVALLHHLTPLHEALARIAPEVPVVTQLHGTELLMLEQIEAGPPPGWRHAEQWALRLRAWARRSARVLVTPSGARRAAQVLGLAPERLVPLPSGVDTELFTPRPVDRDAFWREVLVTGTGGYDLHQVQRLAAGVVLVYVGRFTAVKRLDRLIGAFARARPVAGTPASLVLVGGYPGECEGEHPARIAARAGAESVFLAGWHDHDELPDFLCASDLVVTASEREQFGLVLVEGMACGLPVLATQSPGPELIVEPGRTGWLVPAGDEDALVSAMIEAIDDERERERRGAAALEVARERFSWTSIAARLAGILASAARGVRSAPAAGA
jgi:glycosyltransferase involved in cell wall biosynthesis